MEQRQQTARRLASSITWVALAVSAAGVVRTLYRFFAQETPAPRPSVPEARGRQESLGDSEGGAVVTEENQFNGTGILMAAVAGAAIGAGVALLFAPQSGQQSRDWLARRTRGLKDGVGAAFDPSTVVSDRVVTP
jgi:hypothetical protein